MKLYCIESHLLMALRHLMENAKGPRLHLHHLLMFISHHLLCHKSMCINYQFPLTPHTFKNLHPHLLIITNLRHHQPSLSHLIIIAILHLHHHQNLQQYTIKNLRLHQLCFYHLLITISFHLHHRQNLHQYIIINHPHHYHRLLPHA